MPGPACLTIVLATILTIPSSIKAGNIPQESVTTVKPDSLNTFWGAQCQIDFQCSSTHIGDTLVQLAVCNNEFRGPGTCEPSALIWVMLAFILMVLLLIVFIVMLHCCNKK